MAKIDKEMTSRIHSDVVFVSIDAPSRPTSIHGRRARTSEHLGHAFGQVHFFAQPKINRKLATDQTLTRFLETLTLAFLIDAVQCFSFSEITNFAAHESFLTCKTVSHY